MSNIVEVLNAYNEFCDNYTPRPSLGMGNAVESLGFDCWKHGAEWQKKTMEGRISSLHESIFPNEHRQNCGDKCQWIME